MALTTQCSSVGQKPVIGSAHTLGEGLVGQGHRHLEPFGDHCRIVPSHHELVWVMFRQPNRTPSEASYCLRWFFCMGSLPFQWLSTSQGLSRPLCMSPVFIPIFPFCLALASDGSLYWKINSPLSSFVSIPLVLRIGGKWPRTNEGSDM